MQSSSTIPTNHAGMNLDLLHAHGMEEAESGNASMEEDKPDEDPFWLGWRPDRPNGPADAYPNLLPDREMEDPKTSEGATRTPDVLRDAVDTIVVAVEMDAQTDPTLVPVNTSPDPMAQNTNSRGKSRSPRRHVGEESFGLM